MLLDRVVHTERLQRISGATFTAHDDKRTAVAASRRHACSISEAWMIKQRLLCKVLKGIYAFTIIPVRNFYNFIVLGSTEIVRKLFSDLNIGGNET